MAYNLTEEELVQRLITDPAWCLFYHRSRVKNLLPSLARAYILVSEVQKELITKHYENLSKGDIDEK